MKMVELGSVAAIERNAVDPSSVAPETVYLGLEHIERGGRIVGSATVGGAEVASTKFKFTQEHVLFGKLRPNLGKISRPAFAGVCSTDILPIRPGKDLDRDYLAHYLAQPSMVDFAASRTSGANLPRLSPAVLARFSIPLPPLPEQRRIAAILDHADALRAKRREILTHLDALTQSTFYRMFGDPVSNPKGWPARTLGDQSAAMQYGPRFYNESYSGDGIRIVRITDLDRSGGLNFESMPRMSVSGEDRRKFRLSPGDIVFARTGATVGKLAVIRGSDPECIAGAYFIRITLNDEVLPDYAAVALRTRSIQDIIWTRSHQSAQQNFSGPGLRALPLPLPPLDLQHQFASHVEAVQAQHAAVQRAAKADDELFASLQSRAFRGEL